MHNPHQLGQEEILAAATEMLSRRYGGTPEFSEIEDLGGLGNATVLRVRLAPSAFLPHRSLVVKYNPETGHDIEDAALLREVVAYQFTTSLTEQVRPGPVLLAYDLPRRILILSDVGVGDTLADTLTNADDERRITLLRQLGSSLGQMHAGTAGREEDYEVLANRLLRQSPQHAEHQGLRDDSLQRSIMLGHDIVTAAGLDVPNEVVELAREAAATLRSGKDRAFTPFDLSPDNIIVADRLHFLDYEWAGFRNVGFDVACVIAGFPQFLFTRPISDAEAEVFINAWSREVTEVWPRFGDEAEVQRLIVTSLIGWALSSVATMYTGGLEELAALGESAASLDRADDSLGIEILRPAHQADFSEDERLIRRDLYETFEALARYAASCDVPNAGSAAEFGATVARRVSDS